jgi:hypothetical protein
MTDNFSLWDRITEEERDRIKHTFGVSDPFRSSKRIFAVGELKKKTDRKSNPINRGS